MQASYYHNYHEDMLKQGIKEVTKMMGMGLVGFQCFLVAC
jgi:hypothetical protein